MVRCVAPEFQPSGTHAQRASRNRRRPQGPRHPPGQPRGAPRYLLGRRRARLPHLRRHRALRGMAHLRTYPRRHRRSETARSKTRAAATRSRDGFGGGETHRSWFVARSSGKTARDWPGILLRQVGLQGTALARARADTIRAQLLKVAARITVTVCRIRVAFPSVDPLQELFAHVLAALRAPPVRAATGTVGGVCPAARHPARSKPGIRSVGLRRAQFRRPRAAGHRVRGVETDGTAARRLERAAAGPVVSEGG